VINFVVPAETMEETLCINFTFSEPFIVLYICVNEMRTFFSFIYVNCTFLYMFRTNQYIIRRLFLYTQHIVVKVLVTGCLALLEDI